MCAILSLWGLAAAIVFALPGREGWRRDHRLCGEALSTNVGFCNAPRRFWNGRGMLTTNLSNIGECVMTIDVTSQDDLSFTACDADGICCAHKLPL
jgi:hypothetical protein